MKTVFARAVVALSLVSLPASALAASKAKHHHHADASAPSDSDAIPAAKPTTKHHHTSHKTAKNDKLPKSGEKAKAVASSGHSHKAPVASKSIPAEPLH